MVDIEPTESTDAEELLSLFDGQEPPGAQALPADMLLDVPPRLALRPRPYQQEALRRWLDAEGRGVVVLPTGAGKTVVAMMAIEYIAARTLVVVPTIELLGQWKKSLVESLGLQPSSVGIVGGGCHDVRPVTVITYQSAMLPTRELDGFGLLIFDEVHHLPAPRYRTIPYRVGAPNILGLTATSDRTNMRERDIDALVGPEVYRRVPSELAREKHIASFTEKRIYLDLSARERLLYDQMMAQYRWYLATRRGHVAPGPAAFQDLIRRSAVDPAAREALKSHREARMISFNASAKIAMVGELLQRHRDDKVIVFSEFNAIVDKISRWFLLPSITYKTPSRERRLILQRFREGRYSKLVSGRVLNEGVDVPDATVAIVVSGSASEREYVQRLGRVLRPKPNGAILYELITRRTGESRTAARRRPRD